MLEEKQQNNSSQVDNLISDLKKKKDSLSVKEMPSYPQLLSEMSGAFKSISPKLYSSFNKAIHLDPNSLVKISETKTNGSEISGLKDCCLTLVKIIVGTIRINTVAKDTN